MIKFAKLPSNIDELLAKAVDYLRRRPDIEFAYFFGSIGSGKRFPLSDIDIAIYLKDLSEIHEKKMEILGTLMDLLKTDEIDLVILNRAPLTLRMKILESKKVIVDNTPFLRHHYESLTMREYFDFAVKEQAILQRRFSRG